MSDGTIFKNNAIKRVEAVGDKSALVSVVFGARPKWRSCARFYLHAKRSLHFTAGADLRRWPATFNGSLCYLGATSYWSWDVVLPIYPYKMCRITPACSIVEKLRRKLQITFWAIKCREEQTVCYVQMVSDTIIQCHRVFWTARLWPTLIT